ncbi:hypothetical protein C8A03DRAFT_28922 [Achaetomium macrosporum]|uniref:Letm1 RBD domain-containing protein n=1 Tax=Achaetomium macrosporum TaxID=79813 RepID=A0AAN7CJS6_9PEZI|nr:hypothetical protein C8A03DRAFT_28922 [Achaetomium macrosporum]
MRRSGLLSSALRANARRFPKCHGQPSTILISLSRELSQSRLLPRRSYSSASPASQPQPPPQQQQPSTTTIFPTPTTRNYDLANPPPTTRPPPLNLASRPPEAAQSFLSQANFSYLLARGKAYLSFYKTGLKHIYTNTRLLYSKKLKSKSKPNDGRGEGEGKGGELRPPPPGTRAHLHLKLRWAHDVRRLPLFALVLLVCEEFTPLVVLALPRAVPLPCRIPRQVERLEKEDWRWREEGRREVANKGEGEVPVTAVAKILGFPVRWWTPGSVVRSRVERRLRFLEEDDELLVRAGGAGALVPEEVRLACADRGIEVLGRGAEELRAALGRWLRLTDTRRVGEQGRKEAVMRLLLRKESEWEQ